MEEEAGGEEEGERRETPNEDNPVFGFWRGQLQGDWVIAVAILKRNTFINGIFLGSLYKGYTLIVNTISWVTQIVKERKLNILLLNTLDLEYSLCEHSKGGLKMTTANPPIHCLLVQSPHRTHIPNTHKCALPKWRETRHDLVLSIVYCIIYCSVSKSRHFLSIP